MWKNKCGRFSGFQSLECPPNTFSVFCLIIFMCLHILYLYLFNFHATTLVRSIFVEAGPLQKYSNFQFLATSAGSLYKLCCLTSYLARSKMKFISYFFFQNWRSKKEVCLLGHTHVFLILFSPAILSYTFILDSRSVRLINVFPLELYPTPKFFFII